MTLPKTIAQNLRTRLSEQQIAIKHTQALSLIAAACGLNDRHVLSKMTDLPVPTSINSKLLESAATVIARHDLGRRQIIVETTSSVVMPQTDESSSETTTTPDTVYGAIKMGLELLEPYIASFGTDPDSPEAAVLDWHEEASELIKNWPYVEDIDQATEAFRNTLGEGFEAILNISHILPSEDPLREWIDTAQYPYALNMDDAKLCITVEINDREFLFPIEAVRDPSKLTSSKLWAQYAELFKYDITYTQWSQGDPDEETISEIAGHLLKNMRANKEADTKDTPGQLLNRAVMSALKTQHHSWDSYHENEIESAAKNLFADIKNAVEEYQDQSGEQQFIADEWEDHLQDIFRQESYDSDDSEPKDYLPSRTDCDLIFYLTTVDETTNSQCEVDSTHIDPDCLVMEEQALHALSVIGYTAKQYKKFMGSTMELQSKQPVIKTSEPIISLDDIKTIVENACSRQFNFVVFARVDIRDLAKIDLSNPFTLSKAWLATYCADQGVFMDSQCDGAVTLVDGSDGFLHSSDYGYTPDSICGLVLSHYKAEIYDEEHRRHEILATASLKDYAAVEGYELSLWPNHMKWLKMDENVFVTCQSLRDPANSYKFMQITATFLSSDSDRSEVTMKDITPR